MAVRLLFSSRRKRYGVVAQSREATAFGADARTPVSAQSVEEVSELGGDEREAGADDGSAFAGAGEDEEGNRIICGDIK